MGRLKGKVAVITGAASGIGRGTVDFFIKEGANVGSSDDTSFVLRRIPSIGFFSGFHSDYHRPSDDWQKIEPEGAAAISQVALTLARRLAARLDPIGFEEPTTTAHGGGGEQTGSSGGGYGPYFGSVPDLSDDAAGVKFAEIRAGSPAARRRSGARARRRRAPGRCCPWR